MTRPLLLPLLALLVCRAATPRPEAVTAPAAPPVPALWGGVEAGPYAVGFRVLSLHDTSRPHPATSTGRPLQLALWYPALDGHGEAPLVYGDYVGLTGLELHPEAEDPGAVGRAREEYLALLASNGVPRADGEAWLTSPMAARPDAPSAPGAFPLVLLAQGNFHSAHHQAVLAEVLASHGFLVATLPSQTRLSGPMQGEADIPAHAREQARDLAFALASLRNWGLVGPRTPVGLVGHSFGARAALVLALEEPQVRALVSLDGGIGSATGRDWWQGLPAFAPERPAPPLLHLFQQGDTVVQPDFSLLRRLTGSERTFVRMEGMRHGDFTSLGAASRLVPALAPGHGGAAGGYADAVRLTRAFLAAHLLGHREEWEGMVRGRPFLELWPRGSGGEPGVRTLAPSP